MKLQTQITRHTILELIITLYLARLLFPLPFRHLPFPLYSNYFYSLLVFLSFAILYPKTYVLKALIPFYIFFIIQIIFTPLIWSKRFNSFEIGYNLNIKSIIVSYYPILISLLIYFHYIYENDFFTLGRICKRAIILTFLGVINSLLIFSIYSDALIEYNIFLGAIPLAEFYSSLGLLDYGFFSAICSIFPIFIYMVMETNINILAKACWLLLILLSFYSIICTQITAFLLFAVIFGIGSIFLKANYKKDIRILIILLLIIILFIPQSFIAQIFYKSSELFTSARLQKRIYDAGLTLENPIIDYYSSPQHAGRRLGRIPILFESFLTNPIIGGGLHTNHVKWLDMLSVNGLLGFLPWVWLIVDNYKRNLKILDKKYVPSYILCVIAFIAMGFLKNTGYSYTWIFWFLIVPGSNFIYRTYSDNNNYL